MDTFAEREESSEIDFGGISKVSSPEVERNQVRQVRVRNQGEVELRNGKVGDFCNGRTVVVQYLDPNPLGTKYTSVSTPFLSILPRGNPRFP